MEKNPEENAIVASIQSQWRQTMRLLRRSVECFNGDQWMKGISGFEVPWKVAYHTLQCLAYYFRDDPALTYRQISPHFGKDWWQLSDEKAPSQEQVLAFLDETADRLEQYFHSLSDADLSGPFPDFGIVQVAHDRALRHTMHHQGGLNVLSVFHGIDAGLWDGEG